LIIIAISQLMQRTRDIDSGLVNSSFAPITEREIGIGFRDADGQRQLLKNLKAFCDQVLGGLLAAIGEVCAAEPTCERADPQ